jgi:hypothetical protein
MWSPFSRIKWDWLNKPIGLWLVTSFSLSIFGYLYTNYSSCRAAQAADDEMISRIVQELAERRSRLSSAILLNDNNVDQRRTALEKALEPDRYYSFSEFKGQPSEALGFQLRRLMRRWNVWMPDARKDREALNLDTVGDRSKGDAAGSRFVLHLIDETNRFERWSRYFVNRLGGEPKFVEGELWRARDASPKVEAGAQRQAEIGFITPSACISRTFWPF